MEQFTEFVHNSKIPIPLLTNSFTPKPPSESGAEAGGRCYWGGRPCECALTSERTRSGNLKVRRSGNGSSGGALHEGWLR